MGKGVRSLTSFGQQFINVLYFFLVEFQLAFYQAEAPVCCQETVGFLKVCDTLVCASVGITGDVCLILSLVTQSDCSELGWFPTGLFPPSLTQDIQLSYAETAISRKDCLENPSIFLLPFVILRKHFERAEM